MADKLQQNEVHVTFASVVAKSFGTAENAPGSLYSPQRNDTYRLQMRFRDTDPDHIKAVYEMAGNDFDRAVATLTAAKQKETQTSE